MNMTDIGLSQKIVIVEDNASLADIYKTRLELLGYTCFIGYNGITALYFIQQQMPDLVLLDLMIPDISGEQVLQTMRSSDWGKEIKVLVISNLSETDAPPTLRQLGIEGYAVKANLSDDQIDVMVNAILRPVVRENPNVNIQPQPVQNFDPVEPPSANADQ
jgi:DNA-binding response OmpR family regulator